MNSFKNFITLFFIAFLASFAFAQESITADSTATQTLFSKGSIKELGLYVAPEIGIGQYGNAFTPIASASAMLLLNNKWAIGVSVSKTLDNQFAPKGLSSDNSVYLDVMTQGLKVEYGFAANKVWHLTLPVGFGIGNFRADTLGRVYGDNDFHHGHGGYGNGSGRSNNHFGYLAPGLNLEVNVTKFTRFFLGASYRVALGLKNNTSFTSIASGDFSGLGLAMGVKAGLFEFNVKKDQSVE